MTTTPNVAQLITSFYGNVIAFLHVHHHGEETLVFPLLRERCAGQLELIDAVAAQHRDVDELVTQSVGLLEGWSAGDATAKAPCAQTLGALGGRMEEHLDDEEQHLLPLCAASLTEEEWAVLPGHALGFFNGRQGVADPGSDPGADERRAEGRHAGPHAAPGRGDVDHRGRVVLQRDDGRGRSPHALIIPRHRVVAGARDRERSAEVHPDPADG